MWFRWRERIGKIGFYVLFALMVTMSVQLVGVYLVFTTLIVPALAMYRHARNRQLLLGYAVAFASYVVGLAVSLFMDLPSSPVIVWGDGGAWHPVDLTARGTGEQFSRRGTVRRRRSLPCLLAIDSVATCGDGDRVSSQCCQNRTGPCCVERV